MTNIKLSQKEIVHILESIASDLTDDLNIYQSDYLQGYLHGKIDGLELAVKIIKEELTND